MIRIAPFAAVLALGAGVWAPPQREDVYVIVTGGARGSLAPCGCTKPMTGGLKRMATVVRELKTRYSAFWVDAGDITSTSGRQSVLKLEGYAQVMGELGVDAFAITASERALGAGTLLSMKSLAKGVPIDAFGTSETRLGQLTIGVKGPVPKGTALDISLDGSAASGAEVFASGGAAVTQGKRVSPGEALRGLVLLRFSGKKLVSAKAIELEPRIVDDAQASRAFLSYLDRVRQEQLAWKQVKTPQGDFVGSSACVKCHASAAKTHFKSAHAHAMATLKTVKHDADPDCISCHSVGYTATTGFSLGKERQFGDVGCESCHGAGGSHVKAPKHVHFAKVGEKKCLSCHTTKTSPGFNFLMKWKQIKHR